jgi:hypothetical protein
MAPTEQDKDGRGAIIRSSNPGTPRFAEPHFSGQRRLTSACSGHGLLGSRIASDCGHFRFLISASTSSAPCA